MSEVSRKLDIVGDDELRTVHGMGLRSWVKKAARWVKDHIKVTKNSISVKGKHDVGGG